MRRLLSLALVLAATAPPLAQSRMPARLVAIGDVHGAHDELVGVLQRTGLIDERLRWSGGRTVLVQTGDTTDRGAGVRQVLDLLMRLEGEAKAAGGQVITLLGNHEVMNFVGDWRDVTPAICAAFADAQSEQRRETAWTAYERLRARHPERQVYQQTRDAWIAAHPPGCLEYREAMSPSGLYGRWLRGKGIAAQVGDTLFMHAGISPASTPVPSIDDVNRRARDEIRRLDDHRKQLVSRDLALPSFTLQELLEASRAELRAANDALAKAKAEGTSPPRLDLPLLRQASDLLDIGGWSLFAPEGPLWFRGYAQWDEAATRAQVDALLDRLKLARIAVGHTVTPDHRITPRYDGRVILLDTGMLTAIYKGRPAALEITGTTLRAIYPDGSATLPATPATPAPAARSHSRPQS